MCHVLCAHHRIYLRKKLQKAEQIREDIWKLRFEKKNGIFMSDRQEAKQKT